MPEPELGDCLGYSSDYRLLASALKSFAAVSSLRWGKSLHGTALKAGHLSCHSVSKAVLNMYAKCRALNDSRKLFGEIGCQCDQDPVFWNILLSGFASSGAHDAENQTLSLFKSMHAATQPKPSSVTLAVLLPVCARFGDVGVGRSVHGYAVKSGLENHTLGMFREGIQPDSITVLTILQYCASVLRVDKVKEAHCYSIRHDLLLYHAEPKIGNAILDAYSKCDHISYAFKVFQGLSEQKNLVSFNSMISGYVNSGLYDDANMIFNEMLVTDLTTWNLMVRAYTANNCPAQAFDLFRELQ
ncbi:hypothetical protein Tsubulata_012360, partial [Turnera subulata]